MRGKGGDGAGSGGATEGGALSKPASPAPTPLLSSPLISSHHESSQTPSFLLPPCSSIRPPAAKAVSVWPIRGPGEPPRLILEVTVRDVLGLTWLRLLSEPAEESAEVLEGDDAPPSTRDDVSLVGSSLDQLEEWLREVRVYGRISYELSGSARPITPLPAPGFLSPRVPFSPFT